MSRGVFTPVWHLNPESKVDLAALLLRLGLAGVFLFHGLDKVLNHAGGTTWLIDLLKEVNNNPPGGAENGALLLTTQVVVAWGEVLGGAALLLGLFTRPAAVALAVLQGGAVALSLLEGVGNDKRGAVDFNLALIVACVVLVVLGAARYSVDNYIKRMRRAKAAAPAPAEPAAVSSAP